MNWDELPSLRDPKYAAQMLYDPFSLLPVDIDWLEKKRKATDIERGILWADKIFKPLQEEEYQEPIPVPIHRGRPRKKKSNEKLLRKAREDAADGQFTEEEWIVLKEKYEGKCLRCGVSDERLYPDHIVSLFKGGVNMIHNIQPLCRICNFWKGMHKIDDFRPPEDKVDTFLLYNSED